MYWYILFASYNIFFLKNIASLHSTYMHMHTINKNQRIKIHLWHTIKRLSNLTFAITILLLIASSSIIGTIIEQDQNLEFYQKMYSNSNNAFGFPNWKIIKYLQLDHLYTNWWFLSLITIFISSLIICTFSTQLPILRSARKWKFYCKKQQILNSEKTAFVTSPSPSTIIYTLNHQKYLVFQQNNKIYAYKGLIGRLSPIFVHLSIILLLAGALLSLFGEFVIQEIIPNGETFHIQNIIKSGRLSYIKQDYSIRVNNFFIKYNQDNSIQQFLSQISIITDSGTEVKKGIIQVNSPMYFRNITIYQNDWDIIALRLKLNDKTIMQIPCKSLIQNKNKIWVSTIKISDQNIIYIIIPNLQGQLYFYNTHGNLITKTNINKTVTFKRFKITIKDIISRTGLQIKADPGITIVYLSFMLLILSIITSYTSYSQLWIIHHTYTQFQLGGNTNRGYLTFEEDLEEIQRQNSNLYLKFEDQNNY